MCLYTATGFILQFFYCVDDYHNIVGTFDDYSTNNNHDRMPDFVV